MGKITIRGQAVIEGILLKKEEDYVVAMRKSDNKIEIFNSKIKSNKVTKIFLKIPILRGIIIFLSDFMLGMRAFEYSASFYEEKKEKKTALEKYFIDKLGEKAEHIIIVSIISLLMCMAVIAFIVLPSMLTNSIRNILISDSMLAFIEGVIRVVIFIGYLSIISMNNDIKRLFMYHGAEHKVSNCFESGETITMTNVRRHSRFQRGCPTSFALCIVLVSIFLFMFVRYNDPLLRIFIRIGIFPIIIGCAYEVIKFIGEKQGKIVNTLSKVNFLFQRLITKEPDDDILEVAIRSMESIFNEDVQYVQMKETIEVQHIMPMEEINSGISSEEMQEVFEEEKKVEFQNHFDDMQDNINKAEEETSVQDNTDGNSLNSSKHRDYLNGIEKLEYNRLKIEEEEAVEQMAFAREKLNLKQTLKNTMPELIVNIDPTVFDNSRYEKDMLDIQLEEVFNENIISKEDIEDYNVDEIILRNSKLEKKLATYRKRRRRASNDTE